MEVAPADGVVALQLEIIRAASKGNLDVAGTASVEDVPALPVNLDECLHFRGRFHFQVQGEFVGGCLLLLEVPHHLFVRVDFVFGFLHLEFQKVGRSGIY